MYKRDTSYYSRWTNIPAKLISEYQAVKEDPKAIYRDMRYCTIQEPETITHARAVKLIRRYKEALPDSMGLRVVKGYLQTRLEELRKMELKDTYTRAVLIKQMATVMSEADAHLIKSYLDANAKSVPMRELANSVIKNRMQNYLRQTSTKPAEQVLPLNPTNRQHMMLHKLAVEEKPLPNAMKAKQTQKRPFNGNNNNNNNNHQRQDGKFKKARGSNNQNRSFNGSENSKTSARNFSGAQRPQKQNGQQRNPAGRGQQQQGQPKPNGCKFENLSPADAVVEMKKAYDFSKIADKLTHFGTCTPDVQLLLAKQLEKRGIPVAPNDKKSS